MNRAEQLAGYLLDIGAFHFSFDPMFTWASGIKSPIYTDNRKILSYPLVRNFVIDYFEQKIKELFASVQVLAGVATGGIPYAAILSDRLGLPMVYVRSKPKDHGLKNLVEGFLPEQSAVVVIEDLVSTGGSSLNAIKALQERANVIGLLSVFSYGLDRAKDNFQQQGIEYFTLTDFDKIISIARQRQIITQQQEQIVLEWKTKL